MKKIVKYEAVDGKLFDNEKDCLGHELQLEDLRKANQLLQDGVNLLNVLTVASQNDTLSSVHYLSSEDKEILKSMTTESGVTVEHWQCSCKPGYKVTLIYHGGCHVLLYGDAGSWTGSYGNKITVKDLLYYVKQMREKDVHFNEEME